MSAGLSAGVPYPAVSGYVSIAAGQFDFRLVAAGGNCSQDLAGTSDLTSVPPFAAGEAFTVLEVTGAADSIQLLEDDSAAPDSQTAGLRFINASPSTPSLDLGSVQDGGSFIPWLTGVQFLSVGGSAQTYELDANGYLLVPEVANVLLEIESQSQDLLDLSPPPGQQFPLSGEALYTLFALSGSPVSGLFCSDSAPSQSSHTPCVLYPLPDTGRKYGRNHWRNKRRNRRLEQRDRINDRRHDDLNTSMPIQICRRTLGLGSLRR